MHQELAARSCLPDRSSVGTERLPVDVVRDLLGIARAMYVAWRDNGWPRAQMDELKAIGLELHEALDLAHRSEPGMAEYEVARDIAEHATERLTQLMACSPLPLAPVVKAAGERLKKQR
jgi:hypothetical protein